MIKSESVAMIYLSIWVVFSCEDGSNYCAELETARIEQELLNGSPNGSFLAISPERAGAIGRVWPLEAPPGLFCSGVLVGPKTVLTAKHCDWGSGFVFETGGKPDAGFDVIYSIDVQQNAEYDALLIELEHDASQIPIGLIDEDIDTSWVSVPLQLAGYGATEKRQPSAELLFLVASVDEVTQTKIVVSAEERSGACIGDSGGPLLTRDALGRLAVVGILSTGSMSCRKSDTYVRADLLRPWVDENLGYVHQLSEPCGGLTETGFCRRNIAMWCDNGLVAAESCGDTKKCGFSTRSFGYRCVNADDDACLGLDDVGVCENGVAKRCVRGSILESDCASCSLACGLKPTVGKMMCMDGSRTNETETL